MNAERERISEGGVRGWESDLNKGRSATYRGDSPAIDIGGLWVRRTRFHEPAMQDPSKGADELPQKGFAREKKKKKKKERKEKERKEGKEEKKIDRTAMAAEGRRRGSRLLL